MHSETDRIVQTEKVSIIDRTDFLLMSSGVVIISSVILFFSQLIT